VGRAFSEEEDRPSGERVAILSDGLWRRRFGADINLVGKTVLLDGERHTVVGVMPAAFVFIHSADVIVPLRPVVSGDQDDNYDVIARLGDGVSREQALADLKVVAEKFRAERPTLMTDGESVGVRPLQESLAAGSRSLLLILLGAVGFVLLIACANVANLQLTRAVARRKEMAIRQAMGATFPRLVRQLLTESLLIAFAGSAAGLLLAAWGVDYLSALMPEGLIPRVGHIGVDLRVLAFTLITAILTGAAFGLAPAVSAARVDVNDSLKESAGKGTARRGRLRGALVVAEISLALVLLAGAALLIQTFMNLRRVEPGFDPESVLTFQVSPRGKQYDTTAKVSDFNRRALDRIKGLPGVEAAAVTNALPLSRPPRFPFIIEGKADQRVTAQYVLVTPAYFRAMGMKLSEGRDFAETDDETSEGVVIVNEAFARQYLAEGDPLGRRLTIGRGGFASRPLQVVGVASDFKQMGLSSEPSATMFVPIAQIPDGLMRYLGRFWAMKFVARTSGDPLSLVPAAKQELLALDASLAVSRVRSMEQVMAESIAPEQFNMTIVGLFAAIGLGLAAIGIYGVMSYSVAQRTREIGIRMALGARPGQVLRMALKEGLTLALSGVAIGVAGAYALTRVVSTMLFGVSPTDPATFAIISVVLLGSALGACFMPARRAMKVDPMVALRYE
jgi:predicted permease